MSGNNSNDDKKSGKNVKIGRELDTTVKIGNIAEGGVEIAKGIAELSKKISPKIGKKLGR